MDKIHTTELGLLRIKRNLKLTDDTDIVQECKEIISTAGEIVKRGKNWYVYKDDISITVNASSYTIITASRQ